MRKLAIWFSFNAVIAALLFLPVTIGTTTLLTGCAAILPGQDPIVVNAERTTKNAWTLVKAFVQYEEDHRDALWRVDQSIKQWADKIRAEAPPAFEAARNATKTYKRNRTPENKATLSTYLAVVNQLLADASTQNAKAVRANL